MNTHLCRLALLFCALACGRAYSSPSRVWWPGWTVCSSEELSAGIKYSRDNWTPLYPLSHLFDGDKNTAWVYSYTGREWDTSTFPSRYGLDLKPDHPVPLDGLRIMNGQNQSRERFLRNDRVLQIRITIETATGRMVRKASLRDRIGWHTVSLPHVVAKDIKIEFTDMAAARSRQ